MADNDTTDADCSLSVRFLLPRGKTETTCTEDLSYAFDQAQDNDFNPSWIDEDSCLELNPGKTVNNELFFSYFRDPA